MKNMFYIYLMAGTIIFLFIIFFIFSNTKNKNKEVNQYNDDKITIYNTNNKKIVENKNYDFDLVLDKDLYVNGYDQFIQISKTLVNNECVINISSERNANSICDYIKNECIDMGCKEYVCEKYKKGWYKTIETGDFFGTGDVIFARKNNDYMYFINLECVDKREDDESNPLIEKIINGFRYNS